VRFRGRVEIFSRGKRWVVARPFSIERGQTASCMSPFLAALKVYEWCENTSTWPGMFELYKELAAARVRRGVLASASPQRSRIAPVPAASAAPVTDADEHPALRRRSTYRPWAELLKRTFDVDVLSCPSCGGRMKLLAMVTDSKSVVRYLRAVREPKDVPRRPTSRGSLYGAASSCAEKRSATSRSYGYGVATIRVFGSARPVCHGRANFGSCPSFPHRHLRTVPPPCRTASTNHFAPLILAVHLRPPRYFYLRSAAVIGIVRLESAAALEVARHPLDCLREHFTKLTGSQVSELVPRQRRTVLMIGPVEQDLVKVGVTPQVRCRALHDGYRSCLGPRRTTRCCSLRVERLHALDEDARQRTEQRAVLGEPRAPLEGDVSPRCRSATSGSTSSIRFAAVAHIRRPMHTAPLSKRIQPGHWNTREGNSFALSRYLDTQDSMDRLASSSAALAPARKLEIRESIPALCALAPRSRSPARSTQTPSSPPCRGTSARRASP